MVVKPAIRELMRRYLLGDVSEQERTELEERYASDPHVFEELIDAENELVDLYLRGRLADHERARFESHYLNTREGREAAAFGRSLAGYISADDQKPLLENYRRSRTTTTRKLFFARPAFGMAAAAAIILIVVGAWNLIETNRNLRRQIQELQQAQLSLSRQNQDLLQQLARTKSGTPFSDTHGTEPNSHLPGENASVLQVTLLADFVRGGAPQNKVKIPRNITSVSFRMNLKAADYVAYDARVETPEGAQVWQGKGLHPRTSSGERKSIYIDIPATALQDGHFILNLSGTKADGSTQDVNSYSFHVTRR
jgi:hypothetical protein